MVQRDYIYDRLGRPDQTTWLEIDFVEDFIISEDARDPGFMMQAKPAVLSHWARY
jgi:hypothetical protein